MGAAGGIRAGRAFIEVFLDSSKVKAGLSQISTRFKSAGAAFQRMGATLLGGGAAVATPLGLAAKRFADFEDQVAATAAVTGATPDQLKAIAEQAKELGRTTSYTASQIAAMQTELGRMGFNPQEILDATPAIQNLGRATQTDLAEAALIAGAALRQFGLDASDTTRVADVLTATANSSAQTLADVGESLSYVGPVAADAGMSLEETAKVIGVLANMGLKGSMAGTGLRRILLSLADPKVQKTLDAMGVNIDLSNPAQTLAQLGKAMAGMPNDKRLALMKDLFDLRGMTGALKISTSPEMFDRISEAIDNAGGAAERTAKGMDDTLGGTFRRVMSAAEGVALSIGEKMAPTFRRLESAVTGGLGAVTSFVEQNGDLVRNVVIGVVVLGALGSTLIGVGMAFKIIGFAVGGLASFVGLIGTMASALPALLIVGGIAAGFASLQYHFQAMTKTGSVLSDVFGKIAFLFEPLMGQLSALGQYLGGHFTQLWGQWSDIATATIGTVIESIRAGDWESAGSVAMAGLEAAWAAGTATLITIWEDFKLAIVQAFMWAVQRIRQIWTQTQHNISQKLMEWADDPGILGKATRAVLGSNLSDLNRRAENRDRVAAQFAIDELTPQLEQARLAQNAERVAQLESEIATWRQRLMDAGNRRPGDAAVQDARDILSGQANADAILGNATPDFIRAMQSQRDAIVAEANARAQAARQTLDEKRGIAAAASTQASDEQMAREGWEVMKGWWDTVSGLAQSGLNRAAAMLVGDKAGDAVGQLAMNAVGSFNVRDVQSALAPSLLDESKKQTEILGKIADNTGEGAEWGA